MRFEAIGLLDMASEVEAPRRKIKELEVMVADTITETPDTTTIVFFTGNDHLEYKPGHFCTIDPHQFEALARWTQFLEDQKGKKEPARAYSLTSAPHEHRVAITVKEETYVSGTTRYPPLLSPLLVRRLGRGTRMVITGFTGPYVLPDDIESRTDHLVHVVAGSGSVPNFSILKHALHNGMKLRHTFIYSNKTLADVCFRRELDALEKAHPDKVKVVNLLTRESDPSAFNARVRKGRISIELLKELIPDPTGCQVYACGPAVSVYDRRLAKEKGVEPSPRFLETSLALLRELGVPDGRIHRESYG
jgi:3-ketosteroid 9alpha-monooxygenase subunit B